MIYSPWVKVTNESNDTIDVASEGLLQRITPMISRLE